MGYKELLFNVESTGSGHDKEYIIEMSSESGYYTERNMVSVPMNDGKHSNEGLTTMGLNGCIAVISRTQNGRNPHGIMTHYDPTKLDPHLQKLTELLESYADNLSQEDTKVALFYPKIYESVDEIARKIKDGIEIIFRKNGMVKMIPYPVKEEPILFTGTEGVLNFDVVTARYDFKPFNHGEGYNPDFHSFL
ncbi:hypothetical protein HQ489_04835 [Candidatus Woesearchaeota archaeon]|nr:hypothetical protein [Candidatus Woesearchaeota archaeon]